MGIAVALALVLAALGSARADHRAIKQAERTCACACRYVSSALEDLPAPRADETRVDNGGPGYLVCARGGDGKAYLKRLQREADAAYFARAGRR
jgi:hypothetical protein